MGSKKGEKMITEEEIHRYHMIERVYGPPLAIPSSASSYSQKDTGCVPEKDQSRKRGMGFCTLMGTGTDM